MRKTGKCRIKNKSVETKIKSVELQIKGVELKTKNCLQYIFRDTVCKLGLLRNNRIFKGQHQCKFFRKSVFFGLKFSLNLLKYEAKGLIHEKKMSV